jgi:hypothetical protein
VDLLLVARSFKLTRSIRLLQNPAGDIPCCYFLPPSPIALVSLPNSKTSPSLVIKSKSSLINHLNLLFPSSSINPLSSESSPSTTSRIKNLAQCIAQDCMSFEGVDLILTARSLIFQVILARRLTEGIPRPRLQHLHRDSPFPPAICDSFAVKIQAQLV